MNGTAHAPENWMPAACTLPTVDRPLRRAEFDDLFAQDVLAVHQTSPREVVFELRAAPGVAAHAATLAAEETYCCSFFTFNLTLADGGVTMAVSVDETHDTVLAALAARSRTMTRAHEA